MIGHTAIGALELSGPKGVNNMLNSKKEVQTWALYPHGCKRKVGS